MVRCRNFMELFSNGKLRTTEVAALLRVHRVTVSRWKSYGLDACDPKTKKRIDNMVSLVDEALQSKKLPLNRLEIVGKRSRLSNLRRVLLEVSKANRK